MSSLEVLSTQEIERRASELEGWHVDGARLVRAFECGNFVGSVDFVNRIVPVAEGVNHHPDLEISWETVNVLLTTHSAGGLTEADFDLAKSIGALA